MCGICGLACLDGSGAQAHAEALDAMSRTLAHRGPDSAGAVIEGPVGLAARRLSIIDLEHSDQPLGNEDGRVKVVQNGEILNYRELRLDLERAGHRFSTEGDTEVLAHLYEEHGLGFAELLRGMFAIAIWDARAERLVIARDRFGIKPVVYWPGQSILAFASDLRALRRAPGFHAEVDLDALDAYLAFNSVPAPMTILAGARKLPAGHLLIWERGGAPEVRGYARPRPAAESELRREDDDELARELLDRLRDSVAAHLVADVPVGVLLSGGVDSGTLTALASEAAGEPVRTFSIGFAESSFNELERARAVASRYGTDHHELVLEPDAVELLPRLVSAFDEPFGDSSALPTYLVSELAASSVKVVLSGEGGDELFGGYYTYVADVLARRLRGPARIAGPLVERLPSSSRKLSLEFKAKRFVRGAGLPTLERHLAWKQLLSPEARVEILGPADGRSDPFDLYRRRYAETVGAESLARLQDVDLGIYLVDDLLVKTDRASMAHSLEARVPFLDPHVAELALALPRSARVRGLAKKRLLRRAVRPLLPRAVVDGSKQGFSAPVAAWLRGEMEGFAREVLSPANLRRHGYLSPEPVGDLLDRHVSGAEDHSREIWGLLAFTLWLDSDGPMEDPPPR
jgi:asparagine synthase (glutamine-hydrolysing)